MKLIKLDATDSTNDYLKDLVASQIVDNFTVVTAENQRRGRGQMGSKWISEEGKNLAISVLIRDVLLNIGSIYDLNIAVAMGVIDALSCYKIPRLNVKWPNDILSENKKIGGILIENSIKSHGDIFSIVGIGLNVNQTCFDSLPKASSLAIIKGSEINREDLLYRVINGVRFNINKLLNGHSEKLWEDYHRILFKKGVPALFQDKKEFRFLGIIQGVLKTGELQILLEDNSIENFGVKDIQILY